MGAVLRTSSTTQAHASPQPDARVDYDVEYFRRIEAVESAVQTLTKAVADGIDHVDRNEKRVRGIVVGATRRFESSDYYDAAVDAELDTLPDDRPFPEQEAEPVRMIEPSVDGELAAAMVPGDWSD